MEYDDGTTQIGSTHIGHWTYHDEHQAHRVSNNTDVRYKNVLIELKG